MSLVMAKSLVKLKELAVKYQDGLDPQEKARYEGKLKLLGGEDPYEMTTSMLSEDVKLLPKITYPDIVNYLVFSPSPYTSDDFEELQRPGSLQPVCSRKSTLCYGKGNCA